MNTNNKGVSSRDSFGSRFGVLVAMAGSAIGLGNLWRFPYLMGENGGAAFIIIYLVFVFILCLPIMFSEFILGRRSQSNVFGTFRVLAPGSKWGVIGIIGVLAAISILAFYSVVGGWSIEYLVKAISFDFTRGGSGVNQETMFTDFVTSPIKPLLCHLGFMVLTAVVVLAGIKKGIEKYTKMMMPCLFVMVIIIAVRSLTLKGAGAGIEYMFKPDFSKITADTFLAALGQAFFSLSLGCGTIMTYGSYVSKKENIMKCSAYTSITDTLFAIIAGCAIMPAVFAFGISPGEGPGLVFITLPRIFSELPMGGIIAILFFVTLLIAALTSSISLLEVFVSFMIEEFKLKRGVAVAISFAVFALLGSICSLSQGVMSDVTLFGLNFFDFFDYLSSNILMPLGGMLIVIFAGWRLGKIAFYDEITNQGTLHIPHWLLEVVFFIVRFIAPVTIAVIMFFSSKS